MDTITKTQAKTLGKIRYFTGVPCKNGHTCERLVSTSSCIQCGLLSSAKYRAINREDCVKRSKISTDKNPEKYRVKKAEWRENNSDKILKYAEDYYEKYPDHNKNWVALNREKSKGYKKKWEKNNPGLVTAKCNKRRSSKLQRTPLWANLKIIKQIYIKSSNLSKFSGIKYEVNHIIPLQGKYVSGLHVENNLEIITAENNRSLGNKHESDYWQD